MEFYKEARMFGLTASSRLSLSDATYNHKGAILSGTGSQKVFVEFWNKGSTTGITLNVSEVTTVNFTNSIIPARLAAVTANAAGVTLGLFI